MTDAKHARLTADESVAQLAQLGDLWTMNDSATTITRTVRCKGFAKAVYVANLAAFHADRQGHHPDIAFGFGYCTVSYTTHDVDGLSANDFIAAAAFDALLA